MLLDRTDEDEGLTLPTSKTREHVSATTCLCISYKHRQACLVSTVSYSRLRSRLKLSLSRCFDILYVSGDHYHAPVDSPITLHFHTSATH